MEFIFSNSNDISFINEVQIRIIVVKRQLPHLTRSRAIFQHCFFEFVQPQSQTVRFINKLVAENMVKVAMRIEKINGLQMVLLNEIFQFLFFRSKITTGVYNTALPFFVVDYVCILLYRIE